MKGRHPRSSQGVMMDERTSELKEMRDAAKKRRSQLIKGDAKKEDAVEEAVEEKKDDVEGLRCFMTSRGEDDALQPFEGRHGIRVAMARRVFPLV